ncbi:MAG: prepilin-type N-terminal cleavage/methylation domain-containing protein [Candidatus Omnitrophica bacterium]|nr:prepilin-type N-terminal cleavage/methylation domain-containing protein [Candidatus Omnitrophota bacterium]
MKKKKNCGFSLLEMVIAMFIIAIVIAFSLALMGDGLRRTVKANELLTATALAQYEIDYAKNIPFPPTTVERDFKNYDTGGGIDDSGEYQDCSYNSNYKIWVHSKTVSQLVTAADLYRVTVKVRSAKTNALLTELQTYISRNGAI